jgi:hypothetical protein
VTGRELVTAALRLLGVVAPGESLAASEATDGLSSINRMLSSWSTEGLLIYAVTREEFSLVAGTQSYTMGTGATFSTTRPVKINRAMIEVQSSPTVEYELRILTPEEWAFIPAKDQSSDIPTSLYPEGTYPNETLNLYPKPSAAHKLVLYSQKPLTQISTLDTSISLPPGYEEALVYNGAIRLAPEYGRMLSTEVVAIAGESKSNLKRQNHRPRFLQVDAALTGGLPFNIHTGDS